MRPDSFDAAQERPLLDIAITSGGGQALRLYAEEQALSLAFYNHRVITPKSALTAAQWLHGAIRVPSGSSTTNDVDILINGVNQTLTTEAGSVQTLNTTAPDIWLGGFDVTDTRGDAAFRQFLYFDRALSDAEVAAIVAGPIAPEAPADRSLDHKAYHSLAAA